LNGCTGCATHMRKATAPDGGGVARASHEVVPLRFFLKPQQTAAYAEGRRTAHLCRQSTSVAAWDLKPIQNAPGAQDSKELEFARQSVRPAGSAGRETVGRVQNAAERLKREGACFGSGWSTSFGAWGSSLYRREYRRSRFRAGSRSREFVLHFAFNKPKGGNS